MTADTKKLGCTKSYKWLEKQNKPKKKPLVLVPIKRSKFQIILIW